MVMAAIIMKALVSILKGIFSGFSRSTCGIFISSTSRTRLPSIIPNASTKRFDWPSASGMRLYTEAEVIIPAAYASKISRRRCDILRINRIGTAPRPVDMADIKLPMSASFMLPFSLLMKTSS
ncbi:hypothetical protein D3C74_368910 [compost metagenome]